MAFTLFLAPACGRHSPTDNASITSLAWKLGPGHALHRRAQAGLTHVTDILGSLRFAELIVEASFPPGVVNVVTDEIEMSPLSRTRRRSADQLTALDEIPQ